GRADDFAQASATNAAVNVHLEQPVLGVDITLGEEEILVGLGVNMRYTPLVTDNFDRVTQATEGDGFFFVGQRPPHQVAHEVSGGGDPTANAGRHGGYTAKVFVS